MRQIQFIRSNTFLWALAVAAAFALFVVGLFAFTYWKLDDYLIARSDRMIMTRINFIADLPSARRIGAISDHLEQDSRGVQYAGLFNGAGTRLAGNIDSLPRALDLGGAARVCGSTSSRNRRSTDRSSGSWAGVLRTAMSW